MIKEKTLSVSAIREGTVIDHIAAGNGLQIVRLLKLDANGRMVSIGLNLKSQSMGLKDLIKLETIFLSQSQAGQIAIFAPQATVNVIENYKVVKKFRVEMPEAIPALLACPNIRCISNAESVQTLFSVEASPNQVLLRCRFCEKSFSRGQVRERGPIL